MTIAFDAWSNSAVGTSDRSWTHTPAGTPRAAIVFFLGDGSTDQVSSVTYGGVTMTEVSGSPNIKGTGETVNVSCFFLGSNIPTGAQTVTATTSGTADRQAGCVTLTAENNCEVIDSDGTINSDSQANPSVTLGLLGRSCFCAIGFASGQDAVTGITPFANWTARSEAATTGNTTFGMYTYDIIGTANVSAGWTQTADDAVAIAIAVSEILSSNSPPGGGYYVVGT